MFTSHVRADNTAIFYYPDLRPHTVYVIGDFNGWQTPGIPMRRIENGWKAEIGGFPPGETAYKFVADGHWVNDPHNVLTVDDGYGNHNSVIYHRVDKGSVYHFDFYAPAVEEYRGYCIYLPPGYFYSENHYSSVYLLHGLLDWEYTWTHKGYINKTIDHLRQTGKIGEMIVIMPRENGEFFNGNGMFADYIFKDLLGHIDFEFKTIAHPDHRAIDGLSTGGYSSLVIGAANPHLYASVGGMSSSIDARVFQTVRNHADQLKHFNTRFHITCGEGDPSVGLSGELAKVIRSFGIECEFFANPGPHDWEFWGPAAAGNLQFHWWSFQR
jgi:enterochelin esterase-like enzyme